jgi:hypothetical protein
MVNVNDEPRGTRRRPQGSVMVNENLLFSGEPIPETGPFEGRVHFQYFI